MRKTKTVTITTEGRDKGKSFLLTEMPVLAAEKWAARAILALLKAGVDVPGGADPLEQLMKLDIAAIVRIPWEAAEPLLDEMLKCVQFAPAGMSQARALIDSDIEELGTLFTLRKEILGLHFDFFVNAGSLTSAT